MCHNVSDNHYKWFVFNVHIGCVCVWMCVRLREKGDSVIIHLWKLVFKMFSE